MALIDTTDRVIELSTGETVLISEDPGYIYIEGLTLDAVKLPKRRSSLKAIRDVISARLAVLEEADRIEAAQTQAQPEIASQEPARRKPGRRKGQVVETVKAKLSSIPPEIRRLAETAYEQHKRACEKFGPDCKPAPFSQFLYDFQKPELMRVEPWTPENFRDDLHFGAYEQYASAKKKTEPQSARNPKAW